MGLAGGKQAVLGRVLQGVRVSVHLGDGVCMCVQTSMCVNVLGG